MDDDGPPGVPEWVVTYGDMMSLLLTFFIMLVSMSQLKEEGKNRAAMNAMQQRFGPGVPDSGVPGPALPQPTFHPQTNSQGQQSQHGVEAASKDSTGPGGPRAPVERINHGEVTTTGGSVTFEQFSTEPDEESMKQLDQIVEALKRKPNRLIVRGHSFAEPVRQNPEFRNQHDLSFARAHSVAKYLISRDINPRRILVSAAGDSEPRLLTRKIEDRRLNRRVDVFTVDSYVSPPAQGQPSRQGG